MALVLSFEDYVAQYGTISLTNSGGTTPTVASGYSTDSLKTRQLGDICRINSSTGTTIIRIDFSQTTTTAMACGFLAFESDQAFILTFKTFNTSTARTTSTTYPVSSGFPWFTSACDAHETPSASINRLEIWLEPFVGVSTTVDIGRIWYGPAFQSLRASGREWESGPEDTGGVSMSRSGAAYPRVGVISRTVNIPLPLLEEAEIYGSAYAGSQGAKSTVALETGAHSVGKTNELLCFQETTTNAMRPIYGHFQDMPRFRKRAGIYYDTTLQIREER